MTMVTVKDICACIEEFAPLQWQESWDNSGLLVGNPAGVVGSVLLTVDVTEAVVEEAAELQAQMIVSHHPVLLSGLRQITGSSDAQRAIALAIRNDVAIYAAHTNMDAAPGGVSYRMAARLGLASVRPLLPLHAGLQKLVVYVPVGHFERVRQALFDAGAGCTGNYDSCGYSAEGCGTFCALDGAHPFAGTHGVLHTEREVRFETVFRAHHSARIIAALLGSHPYEEPAYDIYALQNADDRVGQGLVGFLPAPVDTMLFLKHLKAVFASPVIRHTAALRRDIRKVALCGGSGSSLLVHAVGSGADAFVTSDFKYHQFADAAHDIVVADIGHFESEQFTKEIFYELIIKNYPTFAVHFSRINTNPINYL